MTVITQKSFQEMEKCHIDFTLNRHIRNSIALWKDPRSYRSISAYLQDQSKEQSDTSEFAFAANALKYFANETCVAPQNMLLYRGMNVKSIFWDTGTFCFNNFMACTPNKEAALSYSLGKSIPVLLELYISKGTPLGIVESVIQAKDGFEYRSIEEPEIYQEMKDIGDYKFDDKWEILLPAQSTWQVNRIIAKKFDHCYADDEIPLFRLKCTQS